MSEKKAKQDRKEQSSNNEGLASFISEAKLKGIEYRDKFKGTWDEIESQIRCEHPPQWDSKEDWQTKIYIPQQAKKSEIAQSYLNKMVFGRTKNFDFKGFEESDREKADHLTDLISLLMGDAFRFENTYVMNESIDLGTGFIKMTVRPTRDGINYTWRSIYNCCFDPKTGHNINNMRYWIDMMDKDINWIRTEYEKEKSIYDKNAIKQFFKDAEEEGRLANEATQTHSQVTTAGSQEQEKIPLMNVRSIDGTGDVEIPAKYKTAVVDEFWGWVPNDKGEYENRVVTVLNEKWVLRNNPNPYGFIPVQWCRTKRRKYDSYGLGYMENTRGLQDLSNTCVNLGFDSLKISAMDIILLDQNKVKDPTSIKYKPLAIWKMKDINGVKIQRQAASSINDILQGLTLIDQIDQDASGITRSVQGSQELSGGSDGTLGEFERKLQLIDQRFLDIGRFIETDYYLPLIKKIFRIVVNKDLFTQEAVNRLIGMDEQDEVEVDAETQEAKFAGKKLVPKLDLTELRKDPEMDKDFRALGITQFSEKIQIIEKLKEALQIAIENEPIGIITKIDELWKRLLRASDVEDYETILRSKDEINAILGANEGGGQRPQQGQPQIPQQPQPQV